MDENLIGEPKFNFLRNAFIVLLVGIAVLIILIWSKTRNQTIQMNNPLQVAGSEGIIVTQDPQGNFTVQLGIECTDGEIIKWDETFESWICNDDAIGSSIIPPTCTGTDKLVWTGTAYACAIDITGLAQIPLICNSNEKLLWNGSSYFCDLDLDTVGGGVTPPSCLVTEKLQWNGVAYVCISDILGNDNQTLSILGNDLTILNGNTVTLPVGGAMTLNGQNGNIQSFTNDSNVTITSAGDVHTLGWSGLLPINRGGTNSNSSPTLGGIAYGDGASYQFTTSGVAGQVLTSNGVGAPTWQNSGVGISSVTPGAGLVGALPLGPGAITLDIQVQNGLSMVGDFVELGGTLLHNTNIAQAGFNLTTSGVGNVGLGTNTPGARVDAGGNTYAFNGVTSVFQVSNNIGNYASIQNGGSVRFNDFNNGAGADTPVQDFVGYFRHYSLNSPRNAVNPAGVSMFHLTNNLGFNSAPYIRAGLNVNNTDPYTVLAVGLNRAGALQQESPTAMRVTDNYGALNVNSITSMAKTGLDITLTGAYTNAGAGFGITRGLFVNVSGGEVNQAAIFVGGNVGIGTALPQALLDISAVENTELFRLSDTTNTDSSGLFTGNQNPETVVAAQLGSLFLDNANGLAYVKSANDGGNTGWVALSTGAGVTSVTPGDGLVGALPLGPGAITLDVQAQNGLAVNADFVELGGPVGAAGAAQLLSNREIPLNGFDINFSVGGVARSQIEDDGSIRSFMDYNVVGDFIQSGSNLGISGNNMRLTTNQLNFVTPAISSASQATTWSTGGNNLTFTSAAGNNLLLRAATTVNGQASYEFTAGTGGNSPGSRRGISLVYNAGTIAAGIDEIGQHIVMNDSRVLTGNVFGQVLNVTGGTNITSTRIGSEIINNENSEFIRFTDNTNTDSSSLFTGNQNPETVVSAQLGSIFLDNANGVAYVKNANDGGNTGWLALLTGAAGSPCPGSTTIFCQNGNNFGANGVLGTNDLFSLAFETNGVTRALFDTNGHFVPNLDDTYDLGSNTNRWRDLFVGPGSINIGTNGSNYGISYDTGSSSLVFNEAGVARNFRVESVADVNSIFVNGTTGTTGIGTAAGAYQMTVSDNGGSLSLLVTSGGGDSIFAQGGSLGNTFTSRNNNLGVHHLNSINGARLALGADSGASTTKETFTIISNGFVGIGAQPGGTGFPVTPSNPLDLHTQDNNSNLFRAFAITRIDADSVASDGIATGMLFRLEGNGGNTGNVGAIDVFLDDSDNILPNSSMRFTTVLDGAFAERMRITQNGNVSIGNTLDTDRLTVGDGVSAIQRIVIDSANQTHVLFKQGGSNQWGISNSDSLPGLFSIYDYSGGGDAFSIEAGGFVGIGNTNPGVRLHVGSNAIPIATTVARFENAGGTCDVTPNIAGGITCTSDERFKTNVQEFNGALNLINQIDVKSYNLINGGTYQVGVIAQGLEQILPDLVNTNEDGYKSVSYSGLAPYLVSAVQEQQELIETSEESIINLQGDIVNLQNSQNLISVTDFQTLSVDFAALSLEVTELENNITITNVALQNEIDIIKTQIADFVTVTSLSTGAVTTIQVNDLTVANSLNILGTVTVASAATFNGNVVIASNLNVLGKLTLGSDNSGEVVIPTGLDMFEVIYSTPYPIKPIVVVSPRGEAALNDNFGYTIVSETEFGFTIKLKSLLLEDVTFNWIVVGK